MESVLLKKTLHLGKDYQAIKDEREREREREREKGKNNIKKKSHHKAEREGKIFQVLRKNASQTLKRCFSLNLNE